MKNVQDVISRPLGRREIREIKVATVVETFWGFVLVHAIKLLKVSSISTANRIFDKICRFWIKSLSELNIFAKLYLRQLYSQLVVGFVAFIT